MSTKALWLKPFSPPLFLSPSLFPHSTPMEATSQSLLGGTGALPHLQYFVRCSLCRKIEKDEGGPRRPGTCWQIYLSNVEAWGVRMEVVRGRFSVEIRPRLNSEDVSFRPPVRRRVPFLLPSPGQPGYLVIMLYYNFGSTRGKKL